MSWLPVLLLTACAPLFSDGAPADGLVSLSGKIYAAPLGEGTPLQGAQVTFFDQGMVEQAVAEEGEPGSYSAMLRAGEPFFVRIQASGSLSSLWSGAAPDYQGLMFPLYGFDLETVQPFLEQLESELGEIDTESGERVLLWGTTRAAMLGEGEPIYLDQIELWEGNRRNAVVGYRVEDGELVRAQPGELVDWFFGLNLEPGQVTLRIIDTYDPQLYVDTTYFPQAGDVVAAFYTEGF